MEKEEIVKCQNCGEKFTKKGFIYHERKCNEIYAIKDILIQRYLECKNCEILHKEFNIGINTIRKYLKMWGLTLKEATTPKPINTDGRGIKIEFNENYFDKMSSKQYWLIGLMATDGYVNKNNNQFGIAQSGENGKKLIEHIKSELNMQGEIKHTKTMSDKESYKICLSSKKIRAKLAEYNIVPNKTYIYTFPENIPEKYISAYIAGYIEGDGCISISKAGKVDYYLSISFVGTEKFIKKCQEVIPIHGSVGQRKNSPTTFEISWGGLTAVKFGEWLYSFRELYHSYKYNNYITASRKYKKSKYYKRQKAHDEILERFENGDVYSYSELVKEFGIEKDLIKTWIYKANKSGKVTRDYKYLRST